ncbi:MAG: hypothetical protein QG657_3008, partial [Acidobacteriota bacterium]|nr:hypothetical protein [Acidobacteriota bacterium]
MNKRWFVLMMLVVCFVAVSSSDFRAQKGNVLSPAVNDGRNQANVKIEKDYGKMPLTFIPNKGQMDQQVYYYVQGKDKTVYFTSEGVTYSLYAQGSPQPARGWVVKLEFVGAKKNVKPELLESSGTKVSYFKGKPEQWHADLQAASKIIYRKLWRGIDLVYYGTVNKMKYEFIVHPGADPAQIKLAYRGAESVKENSRGQLEIQTPGGGFHDDTPVAWQEIAGKRESVALKYAIESGRGARSGKETREAQVVTYGFNVGIYDTKQTLILDPAVIIYCGYIGGSLNDAGNGIAVDASGCAYVTGYVESSQDNEFPVAVGPDLTYNSGIDSFVAKINSAGTGLIYCGYIGGLGTDYGRGIAIDAMGCAYVTGQTNSTETTFPVTVGPDLTPNGIWDAFVTKVNADGTALDYCGYIGGSSEEIGIEIAVDASGCAYITGYTYSDQTTFPVVGGPDLIFNSIADAFVAKVKADGSGLDFCGYIGGAEYDGGVGIAVDASGCVYVIGYTGSDQTTFPVIVGPDLIQKGDKDAFVAKVNADGTGLVYCGYIGGSGYDAGREIAVDASGFAYVTGYTGSAQTTFPVTVGPDLTYNGGDIDAFVAKIEDDGTGLIYCGYIGGSDHEEGRGIAVDVSGFAYVTGYTYSDQTTFPVTNGPDPTYNGGVYDAFVAKVSEAGTALDYCGYIGGSGDDGAYGIAVDASGCAYVTGYTGSGQTTFPGTVGPDLTHAGGYDAFVAKISGNTFYTVNFAAGNGGSLTGITTQTVLEGSNCTAVEAVPNDGYNFVNWTGTNGFVTTTDNPLTVTNVTSDMMITANFVHSNPAGWVPLEDFQNNMIVYGKAYNGNNP